MTTRAGSTGRRVLARVGSRLVVAVGAAALLGLPAAPAAIAAGAAWYDGGIQYSTITNCVSIIQANPYLEYGAGAYVGFYANPDVGQPAPNAVYYLHIVVHGLGNACSGQRFVPELALPANTTLAISVSNPVYCFAGGTPDQAECPQVLQASGMHPGAWAIWSPDTAHANLWPLPQGGNWEFQVPVISSTPLTSSTFGAYVIMADGNANPTLVPTQGAYVFGVSTPTVLYPSPNTTEIGRTTAKSWANLYSAGLAGNGWFDLGTTASYGLVSDGPIPISAGGMNWLLWDDWQPLSGPSPLLPDTLYHYRVRFQASGTGIWTYGADQTFRTAGAAATFTVTGISSGVAGGTKSSVTVTAKDATNATATTYRGKIHFTSSDPHALLPADYTFTAGDAGVHTFTNGVTLMTLGTQEVRARDAATSSITGAQTGIVITSTDNPPTAALTRPATPTNATTLSYALVFSESVTGLTASDFTRTGTATGCVVGTPSGSVASYTVAVTSCSAGTVILALKAGSVTDAAGNPGPSAAVTAATVTIDRTAPTATLTRPATPTRATTLTYAVTFSENVTGVAAGDFTRTGTATGCVVGTPTGTGSTRSVPVTGCTAGTVILALKAGSVTDAAGNPGPAAAVTAATVTIDRTAPTASAPATALRAGVSLAGASIPVTVAWTGADTGGAGIARYDLARSTDNGVTWGAPVSVTPSVSATTVTGAGTVRFRVRAIDRAGNTGAWVLGPNLTPRIVQAATSYTGSWGTTTATVYSGGSTRYATAAGASASYTFTGRSVAFVTTRAASRGAVRVYVDSVLVTTLDTYAATTAYQRLAWAKTWSAAGTHTVRLVVVGTAGRARVDLDAFAVLK